MAEGYEPKPIESQISTFTVKHIDAGSADKNYILSSTDRYPLFYIFGSNGTLMTQYIQVAYSNVTTLFNGITGAINLNPVWTSQYSCRITVKGYAILTFLCYSPFTITAE